MDLNGVVLQKMSIIGEFGLCYEIVGKYQWDDIIGVGGLQELPRKVLKGMNIRLRHNITLRDENDRTWPVSISSTANDQRHYLGCGWKDFKLSNKIENGCQCDFQFVVDKANVAKELLVRVLSKGGLQK